MEKKEGVQDIADKVLKANKTQRQGRQFMLWILALVVGAALGWLGIKPLNELSHLLQQYLPDCSSLSPYRRLHWQ